MRIRDLQWRGISAWPPEWWIADEGSGEDGFLENVNIHKALLLDCLVIEANHLGNQRKGIIILENPAHLPILCKKNQENIGKPLTEIGDLEIDFGLPMPKMGPKQVRPQTIQKSRPEVFAPVDVKIKSPK